MDETVRWTNLTPGEIIKALRSEHEIGVSKVVVYQLLKKHHYRRRRLYTLSELHTYDHDFHSYAAGVIIPHSLYDLQFNVGCLQLGIRSGSTQRQPIFDQVG